jgi:replicative DNA helicase
MSQNIDHLAPHNVEAEEAVLGSVLLDSEALHLIPDLRPEDFYMLRHQWIWETILALRDDQLPIDYLTIASDLERRGRLEEIGGVAYLLRLISVTPSSLNIEGYKAVVTTMARRRELIAGGSKLAQLAHSEKSDEELTRDAQAVLADLAGVVMPQQTATFEEVLDRAADTILQAQVGVFTNAIPTGIACIDTRSRMRRGYWIWGGRPGMGKSAFWQQVSYNVALKHYGVVYFALEGDAEDILIRMMAQQSGVPHELVIEGGMSEMQSRRVWEVQQKLSDLYAANRLFIHQGRWSVAGIRAEAMRLRAAFGVRLVIIDTINTVTDTLDRKTLVEGMTVASAGLKTLPAEMSDGTVVAIAQLSRGVEQTKPYIPGLRDLRESGALEQDADGVGFMWRPERYVEQHMLKWNEIMSESDDYGCETENDAFVIFAKVRNGKIGKRRMIFKDTLRFETPEEERETNHGIQER